MTDVEKWNLIIQAAVAVGTLLVAILAIWGDLIKHRLGGGPELVLTLDDPSGERVNVSTDAAPKWARYYHLRVSNKRRWSQANSARVVIEQMLKPTADGKLAAQQLSGPLQLMWQFVHLHPMYRTIGPDAICDLGYIRQGEKFVLSPYYAASNFEGFLASNQSMRVILRAVADNAESKPVCVDIAWDGHWSDDTLEMAKHLVVKEVDCSRVV